MIAFFARRFGSLVNMGLRGVSLGFRLLLSFYIVKYLGLDAAGIYGLALGAIGFAPVIASVGLNYFLARDIVGSTPQDALPRLKTRFLVSTVMALVLTIVILMAALVTGYDFRPVHFLIMGVVWLEIYSNDIHVALVAMEMPLPANILVAVKLALWVPFVIGAGLLMPEFRDIGFVFVGWIASYVVYFALLWYFLRGWPLETLPRLAIQTDWLKERLRRSWMIFISDIGMVGFNYIDRYIVSFMLGLTLTGLYTFYWSLATALQTLVGTAIIQLALPALYKAFSSGGIAEWRREMRDQFTKVVGYAGVIAVCIFIASELLIAFAGMTELAGNRPVFLMLLLAAVIRSVSDLLNIGLMSTKRDTHYAIINLSSLVLSAGNAFLMIELFGFVGTGIAALSSAVIVTSVRAAFLSSFVRQSRPAVVDTASSGPEVAG